MVRRDAAAAAALLAVAVAAAVESARLLPYGAVRNPGPGFFPWWIALVLGALALVLLGQALRPGAAAGRAEPRRVGRVLGLLAVLGLYALVLEPAGYPLATFGVVLFMLRVTEPQRWPVALALAALAAGGSYVLFGLWLDVPLPAGPLGR